MKTYVVTINTKSAHFVHEAKARNFVIAAVKVVLELHHLGAKLSNVTAVEAK